MFEQFFKNYFCAKFITKTGNTIEAKIVSSLYSGGKNMHKYLDISRMIFVEF